MNEKRPRLRVIFAEALEKTAPSDRAAYLDRACAGDAALRQRVDALLAAHKEAGEFPAESHGPPAEPGTVIGPYRLMQEIGEGGFGIVYMAEQTEPVRRRVALKILKAGMDTREVVARFEAERQALALMDHPHIARVFGGGTTPDGRPYFVMELVQGVAIHEYCDGCQLPLRDRLDLFIRVCRAVQHAHQKGVIHRDLKPSNVLVSMQDGEAAPKVIDFGVAKATGQRLTEATFHTRFAQMIGTPLYMSPEQAELSALDVDTRSDIYSLGVLLYELLTGTTPLTRERLKTLTFDELRRVIREEDPPTPSARLTKLNGGGAKVAAARRTELKRLVRRVHGELDWIVMKALEKDRTRRYETASALAADLERHLADQPVEACPPSAWYRTWKFARRNGTGLAITAVLGTAVLTAGWVVLDRAARRQALEKSIAKSLAEIESSYREGRLALASAAVQRAEGLVASGGVDEGLEREVLRWRKNFEMLARLDEARLARTAVKDERFDRASADDAYREAFRGYGVDLEALEMDEAASRIDHSAIRADLVAALQDWIDSRLGSPVPSGVRSISRILPILDRDATPETDLLWTLVDRTDFDPWRRQLREAARGQDRKALSRLAGSPEALAQPTATLCFLAHALVRGGDLELAIDVLRDAQSSRTGDFWINHDLGYYLASLVPSQASEAVGYYRAALAVRSDSPGAWVNLGVALAERGDVDGALAAYRKALELKPDYAVARCNIGLSLLKNRNDLDGAVAAHREAIRLAPNSVFARLSLGTIMQSRGNLDEAVRLFREAIDIDPDNAAIHSSLGGALGTRGDWSDAVDAYRDAVARNPEYAPALAGLGNALRDMGRLDEAIETLERAVAMQPELVGAWYNLGVALFESGRETEAAEAYRNTIALDPRHVQAHNNLARILYEAGETEDAIAHYREAIAHDPDEGLWHCNLGTVFNQEGRLDDAIGSFRAAVAAPRPFEKAWAYLGYALEAHGDAREAAEAFRRAIPHDEENASLYFELGRCLSELGAYPAAADAFENAVERDSSLTDAYSQIADWRRRSGDFEAAEDVYRKWIDANPADATAYYNYGCLLAQLERYAAAADAFAEATKRDPSNARAHCNLGAALGMLGDHEVEARKALERAIEIDPDLYEARLGMSYHFASRGKWELALPHFRKLAELVPADVHHQADLAEALSRSGRPEEAAEQWSKTLALCPEDAKRSDQAAWLLATRPLSPTAAKRAVEFAQKAVALDPERAEFRTTLGFARYRAGDYTGAIEALDESIRSRGNGDAYDWLFLAMAHERLGRHERARGYFDRAVARMEDERSTDEALRGLRKEAEGLLGNE